VFAHSIAQFFPSSSALFEGVDLYNALKLAIQANGFGVRKGAGFDDKTVENSC